MSAWSSVSDGCFESENEHGASSGGRWELERSDRLRWLAKMDEAGTTLPQGPSGIDRW